jgi:hypothetical protein
MDVMAIKAESALSLLVLVVIEPFFLSFKDTVSLPNIPSSWHMAFCPRACKLCELAFYKHEY